MRYFLDFDGVIFNVETLKEKMVALDLAREDRTVSLLEAIIAADPHFDLKDLIFDDARRFIEQHAGDCSVVSSYVSTNPSPTQDETAEKAYQEKKIALSGLYALLGEDQVHIVGQSKSEVLGALQRKCEEANEACVFIDDRKKHVLEALDLGMQAFLMIRGTSAETDIPSIHSFDELA